MKLLLHFVHVKLTIKASQIEQVKNPDQLLRPLSSGQ